MVALFLILLFQHQQTDLRVMLDKAYKSESAANEMRDYLKSISSPTALEMAYLGTAEMLMAEHASFPWTKLKHFHVGSDLLDQASESAPKNLEVRYLRFACQTHTPAFLGYTDHLETDKKTLIDGLNKLEDLDLKKRIKTLLLDSKHVSNDEKDQLKK